MNILIIIAIPESKEEKRKKEEKTEEKNYRRNNSRKLPRTKRYMYPEKWMKRDPDHGI